jgi:transcriptional regulator with XRE-family HTH domain
MIRGNTQLSGDSGEDPVDTGSPIAVGSDDRVLFDGQTKPLKYKSENIPTLISRSRGFFVPNETPKLPRWATRIRDLRKSLGMTQTDFAEELRVTQAALSKWENGEHRPSPDAFVRLAAVARDVEKYFFLEEAGLPKEYFLGGIEDSMPPEFVVAAEMVVNRAMGAPELMRKVEVVMVPQLTEAAAASSPQTVDERDVQDVIPIPVGLLEKGVKPIAVRVAGDAMEPVLMDGWIAIIDTSKRDPEKLVGCMVAVKTDDHLQLRWLRRGRNFFQLVPQNTSLRHEIRVLAPGEDWEIIGEVVKWIGEPPGRKPRKGKS